MLHEIQYSIIAHLKNAMPDMTDVVWAYDSVPISGKSFPFATVRHLSTGVQVLEKQYEYAQNDYTFTVGLFCESASSLARLQDGLKRVFLRYEIDLLDTTQPAPPPVIGHFRADVVFISPNISEAVEDVTNMHRVYLDVRVRDINLI